MTSTLSSPKRIAANAWRQALEKTLGQVMAEKEQVLLCITGKSGAGKSTLGRQIRKEGLPGIPPSQIAVIDDGLLAVRLWGIFTRRIKIKSQVVDNLVPFKPWLRNKKLVVYVNVRPHQRVEHCDVVVRLRCPEEERRRRLINRELHGEARFNRTVNACDEVCIPADHVFDLCLVASHDRTPSEESVVEAAAI